MSVRVHRLLVERVPVGRLSFERNEQRRRDLNEKAREAAGSLAVTLDERESESNVEAAGDDELLKSRATKKIGERAKTDFQVSLDGQRQRRLK